MVARAQQATLREVARTHEELDAIGLSQQYLVVNGILPKAQATQDPLATAICQREQRALAEMPEVLKTLPIDRIELKPFNLVGLVRTTIIYYSGTGNSSLIDTITQSI